MRLTDKEKLGLCGMRVNFTMADVNRAVGEFTQGISDLLNNGDPYRALSGIEQVKAIFQGVHNFNHTVVLLAAKDFLESAFPDLPWNEIEFANDANTRGPDVHITIPARIVAELKTTEPCGGSKNAKFGSNQKKEIEKDLNSLSSQKYDDYAKYMFVTSPLAYHCLERDYRKCFPTIYFVLLSSSPSVSKPTDATAGRSFQSTIG
jgi:hypothetical protein